MRIMYIKQLAWYLAPCNVLVLLFIMLLMQFQKPLFCTHAMPGVIGISPNYPHDSSFWEKWHCRRIKDVSSSKTQKGKAIEAGQNITIITVITAKYLQ